MWIRDLVSALKEVRYLRYGSQLGITCQTEDSWKKLSTPSQT